MFRYWIAVSTLVCVALFGASCDDDERGSTRATAAQVTKARTDLQDLQMGMTDLRGQVNDAIDQATSAQIRLAAQLKEIQAGFENLNARTAMLQASLDSLGAKSAKVAEKRKTPGPWYVKLLVVIVALVLVFAFIRRQTRHNEEDDDSEFDDEEVVEKNDLGEIRYPGSAAPKNDASDSGQGKNG